MSNIKKFRIKSFKDKQSILKLDKISLKYGRKTIFRIIGAADAAANLLWEFNIAAKKEDNLINIKKGKVNLVNSTARSIFFLSSTNPGAIKLTNNGIKISTSKTKNIKPKNNKLNISLANFFALGLLLTSSDV